MLAANRSQPRTGVPEWTRASGPAVGEEQDTATVAEVVMGGEFEDIDFFALMEQYSPEPLVQEKPRSSSRIA
ncbi:hypothetical protein J2Y41_003910 [Arthrobacter sp. 1088]|nr:hypothetical protein [Arthrobacter sp. 1088]